MDYHGSLFRFDGRRARRGFAIILTALMLTIVVPMVGLVIDVGIMYAIRTRLSLACDAAALAAARSLAVGQTLADQETSARARAESFFFVPIFQLAYTRATTTRCRSPLTSPWHKHGQ